MNGLLAPCLLWLAASPAGSTIQILPAAPGAPLTVQQAREDALQGLWDDLLLGASRVTKADLSPSDADALAGVLAHGCRTLETTRVNLANSLADRAEALHPSVDGLGCFARTASRIGLTGAAEDALQKGIRQFPSAGELRVQLARLLLSDGDPRGARAALEPLPRGAERAAALRLRQQAQAQLKQEQQARSTASRYSQELSRNQRRAERAEAVQLASAHEDHFNPLGDSGQLRDRKNHWWVIRYFDRGRDFGQRADYEYQVMGAMDEAHEAARKFLGHARVSPLDVLLYSREEFAANFGPQAALAIAGLYAHNAIRINGAVELDEENKPTLVHEYVHAVVDELTGFHDDRVPTWLNEGLAEYVKWQYQGFDHPPFPVTVRLRAKALRHQLPSLTQMGQGSLLFGDPEANYAEAGVAASLLCQRAGTSTVLELIRQVGHGRPFAQALSQAYGGLTLESLQNDLEDTLAQD